MTLSPPNKQRGISLAEMMVAMVIGLLVTLAVSTFFLTSRQSYKQTDATAKMQENARFAMELITQDLRHAGFLGNIPDPADINVTTLEPAAPAQDCTPTRVDASSGNTVPGLYNFGVVQQPNTLIFGNQLDTPASFFGSCLAVGDAKANSSVLLVKRVAGRPTPPLLQDDPTTADVNEVTADQRLDNVPYIYATGSNAILQTDTDKDGDRATMISGGESWEYQPHLYYIKDEDTAPRNGKLDSGEDTNGNGILDKDILYRKAFKNSSPAPTNPTLVAEPLAEGIEAIHIEFGIDTIRDGRYDGAPDYFFTPAANSDPTLAANTGAMNQAVSATIYILARTTVPDPDANYQDTKTYQLGTTGPTIDMDSYTPTNALDPTKKYRRRVYSTTIALRNVRNQVMSR